MGSLIHVAVLWAKIFFSLDQVLGSHLLKAQVRNIWISVEFVQNCFGVERGFMKLNMFAIIVFMVTCAQKIALKKIHYKNFYFFIFWSLALFFVVFFLVHIWNNIILVFQFTDLCFLLLQRCIRIEFWLLFWAKSSLLSIQMKTFSK